VIALDGWVGSVEHQTDPSVQTWLPTLYDTFLTNCWATRDRLTPVRQLSPHGIYTIRDAGVVPDLVYIDAEHDYDSVWRDIEVVHACFPRAIITGDDWTWESVRTAVQAYAAAQQLTITHTQNAWRLHAGN
jgi:hypothetical protein